MDILSIYDNQYNLDVPPRYTLNSNLIQDINLIHFELYISEPPKYELLFPQNINHPYIQNEIIIQPTTRQIDFTIPIESDQNICKKIYNLLNCNIGCYNKNSVDMRCCGLCYMLCPLNESTYNVDYMGHSEVCPHDIKVYTKLCKNLNNICSSDCCICCCPIIYVSLIMCLPGTLFNHFINCIRKTHQNYLF